MNYTLQNLTEAEINLIATGLAELPWKLAAPLMDKLRQQVAAQEAVAAPESPPREHGGAAAGDVSPLG